MHRSGGPGSQAPRRPLPFTFSCTSLDFVPTQSDVYTHELGGVQPLRSRASVGLPYPPSSTSIFSAVRSRASPPTRSAPTAKRWAASCASDRMKGSHWTHRASSPIISTRTSAASVATRSRRATAISARCAVKHPQPAGVQVEVVEPKLDELGAADAGIEQGDQDRLIPCADRRRRIATCEQPGDVVGGEGPDDPLREADVPERPERTLRQVAGLDEPVEEAARATSSAPSLSHRVASKRSDITCSSAVTTAGRSFSPHRICTSSNQASRSAPTASSRCSGDSAVGPACRRSTPTASAPPSPPGRSSTTHANSTSRPCSATPPRTGPPLRLDLQLRAGGSPPCHLFARGASGEHGLNKPGRPRNHRSGTDVAPTFLNLRPDQLAAPPPETCVLPARSLLILNLPPDQLTAPEERDRPPGVY